MDFRRLMFKICWCLWYEFFFLILKKLSCIKEGKQNSARKEKRYKVLLTAGSPTKSNFHFMTGKAPVLWMEVVPDVPPLSLL